MIISSVRKAVAFPATGSATEIRTVKTPKMNHRTNAKTPMPMPIVTWSHISNATMASASLDVGDVIMMMTVETVPMKSTA